MATTSEAPIRRPGVGASPAMVVPVMPTQQPTAKAARQTPLTDQWAGQGDIEHKTAQERKLAASAGSAETPNYGRQIGGYEPSVMNIKSVNVLTTIGKTLNVVAEEKDAANQSTATPKAA